MRSSALRLATFFAVATLVAGCSDQRDVAAPAVSGGSGVNRLLLAPTPVQVVTRNTALASPLTASATVGLLGAHLYLPGAGLSVIIPPLATKLGTRITVTAVAGKQVAYQFEPHGTHFLLPLIATQSLVNTSAKSGGLLNLSTFAAYFASSSDLNPLDGTALVSELLGTTLSLATNTATFTIFHFSGYLIATGRCDTSDDFISQ